MSKLNNKGLTVSDVIKALQQLEASNLGDEEVCMNSAFGGVTIARAVQYDGTARAVFICDNLTFPYSGGDDDDEDLPHRESDDECPKCGYVVCSCEQNEIDLRQMMAENE